MRDEMQQEPAFRARQAERRAARHRQQIAVWIKSEAGEQKRAGRGAALPPIGSCHFDDLLQYSVEHENIDRRRDAIGGPGDAELPRRGIARAADHEDGHRALLADLEDCRDTLGRQAAQIEDDDIRVSRSKLKSAHQFLLLLSY